MNVTLRPMTTRDLDTVVTWSRDREFCLAVDWTPDLPEATVRSWWEGVLDSVGGNFQRLGIVVDDGDGGRLVGYTDLALIEHEVGRASFGIAIGERAVWGRGVGRAAGARMLERAFVRHGLTRVTSEVHAPNARSLALMSRLGFVREGVLRRHERYRGGVCDVVLFGMLREEWSGGSPD